MPRKNKKEVKGKKRKEKFGGGISPSFFNLKKFRRGEKEKMKTKNKAIVLVGIAIVLCSLFLVAIPAIAADGTQKVSASEVTTASEDKPLGVYGNANEDDTIDMRDLTYVKLIFFGKKPATELSDAKYDGKINPLDFIQIKLIIVGKEKELTIVDSADRIVTIKKPVERIIVLNSDVASAVTILGAADKVVGVTSVVLKKDYYFPELSDKPSVGYPKYDYEAILSLTPDLVVNYGSGSYYKPKLLETAEKLPGITVVGLDFYKQKTLRYEVEILGYVLDKEDKACEYNDWCKKLEDDVKNLVDALEPEEKTRVFITSMKGYPGAIRTYGPNSGCDILCTIAGGINIAGELPITYPKVDSEWVISENPDVIITFGHPGQGWADTTEPEELRTEILNVKEWAHISAVENKRVYVCNYELLFGLDSVVGLTYWAKFLHPEFALDSPEDIYREHYEMLNAKYPGDLIQAYPPLES